MNKLGTPYHSTSCIRLIMNIVPVQDGFRAVDQILADFCVCLTVEWMVLLRDVLQIAPCFAQVQALLAERLRRWRRRHRLVNVNQRNRNGEVDGGRPESNRPRPETKWIREPHLGFATKNQATASAGERRFGHGSDRDEREEQGWSWWRRRQIRDISIGSLDVRTILFMLACVASWPAPLQDAQLKKTEQNASSRKEGKGKRPAPR